MINAIDISLVDDTNYLNEYGNKLMYLENVKKINILIGENNSGKSRMMRSLIKNNSTKIFSNTYIDSTKSYKIKNYIKNIKTKIENFNIRSKELKLELPQNIEKLTEIECYIIISNYINSIIEEQIPSELKSVFSDITQYLKNITDLISKPINTTGIAKPMNSLKLIYIPILRGIECFNEYFELNRKEALNSIAMNENQRLALEEYKNNAKHIYQNKIVKAYEFKNKNIVFTAENLYDEITSKLLGEESERNFIKAFQKFISKEFYEGEEFSIIPQQSKGYLSVKIGNNKDKALHNLGDGIKQLITILYKIYENKEKETIFFIEEPEINLHPGYQRKLIKILQMPIFNKHQYFITTHSNHLIDSCFDYENISIYKFININKANSTFQVINTKPNDIEMLQLLGVNNSSVFMANCTIWVEGISDKILISKYLEVYLKKHINNKYKEDIHYSFIEYGGNNITHWSFIPDECIETINASGIANRCFIVCDNDNDNPSKEQRKAKLKEIFKDNYFELEVREIENTISRCVLESALFPDGNILLKNDNEEREYDNKETYMGEYIDNYYQLSKKYSSSTGTGTIVNKLAFAKKIASNINTIDDLSVHGVAICEKIVNFIEKSNHSF